MTSSGAGVKPGSVKTEDVAFGANGLLARLYRPEGGPDGGGPCPTPVPAVVSVHGGTWTRETRLTNAVLDEALAARGILVMAVDFRQPPAARHPGPVQDIHASICWLKRNAAALGSRPELVGGMGTSSGGHQVMLCALRPGDYAGDDTTVPDADGGLAFAVACWGVLDPLARWELMLERNESRYLDAHRAYFADEAQMARENPQRILAEGRQTHLPPCLVLQGDQDHALPADMARNFAETVRGAGGAATYRPYPGVGHTFITKQPDTAQSADAMAAIARFIAEMAERVRQDA
jgi:acetyl esterase